MQPSLLERSSMFQRLKVEFMNFEFMLQMAEHNRFMFVISCPFHFHMLLIMNTTTSLIYILRHLGIHQAESEHILIVNFNFFCRLSSLKSHFLSRPWYLQQSSMETVTVPTQLALTKVLQQIGWRYSFFIHLKETVENNFNAFHGQLD